MEGSIWGSEWLAWRIQLNRVMVKKGRKQNEQGRPIDRLVATYPRSYLFTFFPGVQNKGGFLGAIRFIVHRND